MYYIGSILENCLTGKVTTNEVNGQGIFLKFWKLVV